MKFNATSALLSIMLFLLLTGIARPEATRGAKLRVTTANGAVIEGELLMVDGNRLKLSDRSATAVILDIHDIRALTVSRRSGFLKWGKLLLPVGMGLAAGMKAMAGLDEGWSFPRRSDFLVQAGCTSLFAAGVLAVAGDHDRSCTVAGLGPAEMERLLSRLDRLARFRGSPQRDMAGKTPVPPHVAEGYARFRLSCQAGFAILSGKSGYVHALARADTGNTAISAFKDIVFMDTRPMTQWTRLHAEYALNPKFALGLLHSPLRNRRENGFVFYETGQSGNGQSGSICGLSESHDGRLYFLTLSYVPMFDPRFRKSSFSLGVGAGVAHTTTLACTTDDHALTEIERIAFSRLTPAFTAFAGYEYHLTPNLAFGIGLDYRFVPARVAGYGLDCIFHFSDWDEGGNPAIIQSRITIPSHRIDLGGLTYGVRLNLRF